MSGPVISVVMAIRNGERYLAKAIDSILGQTFSDIELIMVDDGSTDRTAEILGWYTSADQRVSVLSRSNRGLAASLNEAISNAKGKWIARMDCDDIAMPDRLARQIAYASQQKLELVGCDTRVFGNALPRLRTFYRGNSAVRLELLFGSPFCHPAVLCKAEVLRRHCYDETLPAAQDYDLWTRLLGNDVPAGNVGEVLLRYRVHGKQITMTRFASQISTAVASSQTYWIKILEGECAVPELALRGLLRPIFDKSLSVDKETADTGAAAFQYLYSRYGDPEGVLSKNAFLFFLRSPDPLRIYEVFSSTNVCLSRAQHLALFAAARFSINWNSAFLTLLRRRFR